jgi:DNA-binding NarL/FixJ family response regulator
MNLQYAASSQGPARPRVLILDRQTLFCVGVVRLLEKAAEIEEARAATSLREGVRLAGRFCPAVILVDPSLSGAGAFDVARRIRWECPGSRFVFLDEAVRELHVRAAVQGGASGYWTKHASIDQIVAAIGRVAAGEPSFCPRALRFVAETPKGLRFRPSEKSVALRQLTSREVEVFVHLAQGLSVRQCAARMHLATSTVDNHKTRLMKKLDVHKSVDLATLAVREGLVD